jgi:RNA-directed DNA polymerase
VITAATKENAERVKELVRVYIAERGLQLSEEKTVINHITEGFDFLGWNFRKYHNGKLLIKPSKKSQQKFLEKIQTAIKTHKGCKQDDLIAMLNPIINGWSNYHRTSVSKRIFSKMDKELFLSLRQWACRRHSNKSKHWIEQRYWKTVGKHRWTYKDTLALLRMNEKKIIRHIPLNLEKNPYIDMDYFRGRQYRLLVNRNLGLNLPAMETKTGSRQADGCLPEA